jgi:hypothetical protein
VSSGAGGEPPRRVPARSPECLKYLRAFKFGCRESNPNCARSDRIPAPRFRSPDPPEHLQWRPRPLNSKLVDIPGTRMENSSRPINFNRQTELSEKMFVRREQLSIIKFPVLRRRRSETRC